MKLNDFDRMYILERINGLVARDGFVHDSDLRDVLIPYIQFPPEQMAERWITRQLNEFMASIRFADGQRRFRAAHTDGYRFWVTPNRKLKYELSEAAAGLTERALYGNTAAVNKFRLSAATEVLSSSADIMKFDPNFQQDITQSRQEEILETWGPILQLNLFRTAI